MKDKFYMLLQTTDDGTDIQVGSINIYYGIRKKKDAEKHFAAEHYISTLENYQKRYERACKYENEPARKEVLADIQKKAMNFQALKKSLRINQAELTTKQHLKTFKVQRMQQ